ncbi:MAG: peptidoglycan DD-metalloendopeptidase family protein [Acetobacterales bacterium]
MPAFNRSTIVVKSFRKKLLDRLLAERQILVRSQGKVSYVALTRRTQVVTLVGAALLSGWLGFSSAMYFAQQDIVLRKDAEITQAKMAYRDLLGEFTDAQDRFSRIAGTLEQNHSFLLSLVEQNASLRENLEVTEGQLEETRAQRARMHQVGEDLRDRLANLEHRLRGVLDENFTLQDNISTLSSQLNVSEDQLASLQQDRGKLQNRLNGIEGQLVGIGNGDGAGDLGRKAEEIRGQIASLQLREDEIIAGRRTLMSRLDHLEIEAAGVGARKDNLGLSLDSIEARIQRMALLHAESVADRQHLRGQVTDLEGRLATLKLAQLDVVQRLSQRTELSIGQVEDVVRMAGIDPDTFLERAEEKDNGQGGPFVVWLPEVESDGPLHASLEQLDSQLSRWDRLQQLVSVMPLATPVDNFYISSIFGKRKDPINGRWAVHSGLDLAGPSNQPVWSTAAGRVTFAGWKSAYGRMVEIDHGMGIRTRYGHLNKVLVRRGEEIDFRHKIGLLGSTGRSTGNHVHYEVRIDNEAVDPSNFMKAGRYVFKK